MYKYHVKLVCYHMTGGGQTVMRHTTQGPTVKSVKAQMVAYVRTVRESGFTVVSQDYRLEEPNDHTNAS